MISISILIIPLCILFGVLMIILLVFLITRMFRGNKSGLHLPDPRFMGSTTFLAGVSGLYKDAVIPIPKEGIIIGSDAAEANIILGDPDISPQHVRVVFTETSYESILVEQLGEAANTFYLTAGSNWQPLIGGQSFSSTEPAKLKTGANEHIFEIIFRL